MNNKINHIEVIGKIINTTKGRTNNGINYSNVIIEVSGKKYNDTLAFVYYGDEKMPSIGSTVILNGRLRGRVIDDKYYPTLIIENIYQIND
jgi:putative aminopeptidase FrvX